MQFLLCHRINILQFSPSISSDFGNSMTLTPGTLGDLLGCWGRARWGLPPPLTLCLWPSGLFEKMGSLQGTQSQGSGTTQRDGVGREVGGGFGMGGHVYPWVIIVDVWQKPPQYCKVISLQLKLINYFKKEKRSGRGREDFKLWMHLYLYPGCKQNLLCLLASVCCAFLS